MDVNADRMDDIVGITGGTFWATMSQGSFFTVEHWGNHPDAANWANVQPASLTSGTIGFSVGAASSEGSSAGALTLEPVLGFDVLSSAAPLDLPFAEESTDEPGQELLQPMLPVASQARAAIRNAAVDSVFGSQV